MRRDQQRTCLQRSNGTRDYDEQGGRQWVKTTNKQTNAECSILSNINAEEET